MKIRKTTLLCLILILQMTVFCACRAGNGTAGIGDTETEIPQTCITETESHLPDPSVTVPVQTETTITDDTEYVTESVTEIATEPMTEIATEPVTEVLTEPITEVITEPVAEAVTEQTPPAEYTAPAFERTELSPDGTMLLGLEYVPSDVDVMFMELMYRVHILDAESGACIMVAQSPMEYPEIHWSPDSRYVAISYGYNRYYTAAVVLDTVNGREIDLPHWELSKQIFGEIIGEGMGGFYGFFTVPQSWDGDILRVEMRGNLSAEWMEGQVGGVIGYYTYDLLTESMTECSYIPIYNQNTLPAPENDTEQAVYDKLLEIVQNTDSELPEELIAANRSTYAELLSMGDGAYWYLCELAYTNFGPYDPSYEPMLAIQSAASAAIKLMDGADIGVNMAMTETYDVVRETAMQFFDAYCCADLAAAQALVDSYDNPCLEQFPTEPRQAHLSEHTPFELIRCITDDHGRVTKLYADIGWFAEKDPAASFGIIWMNLTLECMTRTDDAGNPYEAWCITAFENTK